MRRPITRAEIREAVAREVHTPEGDAALLRTMKIVRSTNPAPAVVAVCEQIEEEVAARDAARKSVKVALSSGGMKGTMTDPYRGSQPDPARVTSDGARYAAHLIRKRSKGDRFHPRRPETAAAMLAAAEWLDQFVDTS